MKFNQKQDYWANVFITNDFFCIDTYSGLGMTGRDALFPSRLLPPDADDMRIGDAILQALSDSRSLVVREERAAFFDADKVKERYKNWTAMLLEQYQYKTKKTLFKDMKKCTVHCVNDIITIIPTRHEKLEAWGRSKGDGIEDVILSTNSSPAEIGAGLRLALSRCK
ncbi:contact-dependent growth inhibition system immunity protein [Franconibacter daqui]|uniref:contact-dependent growth inhibition system immunity protein n=1 Tax=Franconibacter daqui TaxID=2047724 RepID=UPI0030D04EAE